MSFYQNSGATNERVHPVNSGSNSLPLLITLEQNIQLLKRKAHLVGTSKDGRTLRDEINDVIIPKIQSISRKLADSTPVDSQDKLVRDLRSLICEYNALRASYENRALQFPVHEEEQRALVKAENHDSQYESMPIHEETERRQQISEQTPLLLSTQHEQQRLNQDELDFHTIIQEERSQDISKIHSAVQEVNAIFKQLGSLVQEQGEQVDTIGENVTGLSNNVKTANKELNKANEYQRKKNRCTTILLVVVVVVTLITLIAVLS